MKVLRVIPSMNPKGGGPCQGIRNSARAMDAIGLQNEVVCLDDPNESFLRDYPFKINALGAGRGKWHYNKHLSKWLRANIGRYDAVILHGLWLYPGHALRIVARQSGKKYYVFPHGMLDPWFQRDPSRRYKALRNVFYWKLVEHRVVGEAEAILFTSEQERVLAQCSMKPYRPRNAITVGYGVPKPPAESDAMRRAFLARCPELHPESGYLLFLGRIDPKKGVDVLLKAYADYGNSSASNRQMRKQIVVAGPGAETSYGHAMERLARDLLPTGSITFTGMLDRDATLGALYGSDAVILPSHQENFGLSVVEALSCSKPVLITDKVNIWREIANENAGLVSSDDVHGVRSLLERWWSLSPQQQQEYGQRALPCFERHFKIENVIGRLVEVLQRDN